MHPNHQYTAYLKSRHPDTWQEFVKCAGDHLFNEENMVRVWKENGPLRHPDFAYTQEPIDLLLEDYDLIIEEAHKDFKPEFIAQINVEQIADWLMQEAEDRQITDENDCQRIEEYIEFMRVLKLAA